MKKIVENMKVLPTARQYLDEMELTETTSVFELDTSGQVVSGSFGVLQEYVLKAEICVEFRCNPAQLDSAIKNAEKMVVRRLYEPQRRYTEEAIFAVQNGDKTLATKLLWELLDSMDSD